MSRVFAKFFSVVTFLIVTINFHAEARVKTDKASRYLQALCGHFSRKVTATWSDKEGQVDFGSGQSHLAAEDETLVIRVDSESQDALERLKAVVANHLERFAVKDELKVSWQDIDGNPTT